MIVADTQWLDDGDLGDHAIVAKSVLLELVVEGGGWSRVEVGGESIGVL